jgi:hypothetical protein
MLAAVFVAVCLNPATARACAVCYGQSDSPMARGLNGGIASLLAVVLVVLIGIAGFFFFLARRAAAQAAAQPVAENQTPVTAH